ncbi:hypothetical protein Enr10x_36940 [Gimesia panareensis]|uniref:DUF1583 domain-containing protein n=1 Tax=Gimesia panareensis TaxID=2527978 RepID=A0A517Q9N9_9PLAN|nr:hypothetical protein [Gimesia panareensis]QDT28352.1 hypothetical protein Enr10x_36940 [Gimesia panareensis]
MRLLNCPARLLFVISAALFLLGVEPDSLSAADRERWDFSFRGGEYDLNRLELYGNLAGIKPTADGLRMKLAAGDKKDWGGIDIRCRLEGDFKITGKYTITELGKPEGGSGAGLSIGIKDKDQEWATIQHVNQHHAGEVNVAHRGFRKQDGKGYDSKSKSEKANISQGIMEIERKGNLLTFAANTADGQAPVLIESYEYTESPVDYLHVGVKQGGSKAPVDLHLTEIMLEADQLTFDYQPKTDWTPWIWGAVIAVVVLCVILVVVYKMRQA